MPDSSETRVLTPKVPEVPPFHIRWMIRRDLPEILFIERESFPSPWQEEDFLEEMQQRNVIGMTVEKGEKVVGYLIYSLHKKHFAISHFAVHPSFRRMGVGSKMINKLKSKLAGQRRTRISLEVSESCLSAHLFLRSMGFKAVDIYHFFFAEGNGQMEDAYHFEYLLSEEE